jgi:hypothetical protein
MAKLVSHLVIDDESKLITAYMPGSIVYLERFNDAHWLSVVGDQEKAKKTCSRANKLPYTYIQTNYLNSRASM